LGPLTGKQQALATILERLRIEEFIYSHRDQALKNELAAENKRCRLVGYTMTEAIRYRERSTVECPNGFNSEMLLE
jgi:hypothetical protein